MADFGLTTLAAENARLRQQLAEATASLTELAPYSLGAQLDEARMWARHGYEIGQRSCTWSDHGVAPKWLIEGHDPAALVGPDPHAGCEDERDRLQARLDTATAHVEELRGQRDEARRTGGAYARLSWEAACERDAMRPVVEAAEAWATRVREFVVEIGYEELDDDERSLLAAVDAWRAAQPDAKAPTDRLSATQADERGADDGTGTEGSQAQEGARGAGWRREGKVVHFDIPTPAEVDTTGAVAVGTFEFEVTAPADPAGLDAAIEAAAADLRNRFHDIDAQAPGHYMGTCCPVCEDSAITAVRAAAPHLRAAALNEAADALEAELRTHDAMVGSISTKWPVRWLRERAGRIGGGE